MAIRINGKEAESDQVVIGAMVSGSVIQSGGRGQVVIGAAVGGDLIQSGADNSENDG